ncbi:MAG: glycosyl hydrolase family 18 protein [Eubacterium sp.]|nr:glycosyl hydrolase family 18 protein [Eubacterium sp.]
MDRRRRNRRSPAAVIGTVLVIILIVLIASFLYTRFSKSNERMDPGEYFGIGQEQAALICDDQLLDGKGIVQNGTVYIPFDMVRSYFNAGFYWEESRNEVLLTLPEGTLEFPADDGSGRVVTLDGVIYMNAETVRDNSDIDMEIYQEPARVTARTSWDGLQVREVIAEGELRSEASLKSPIIRDLAEGDKLILLEEGKDFDKVASADGYIGYAQSKNLQEASAELLAHTTDQRYVFSHKLMDRKVVMGFQYMNEGSCDASVMAELIQSTGGMNVIAPTCFQFADSQGTVTCLIGADYVQTAAAAGLQVWGTINDMEGEGGDIGQLLKNEDTRASIVSQLVNDAVSLGISGINVDLESVTEESVPHYIQFLKELSVSGHQAGLIISADAYVPLYTKYLNRREQAKTVDYIVIMGYDEHTNGSEEIGPVASLSYVDQGIKDTLKEVPKEQVINALPFYSRGWTTSGTDISSEAFGMDSADQFASEHGIQLSWDDQTGQLYGSVDEGSQKYSIWVENEQSIEAKMKVVQGYDIGGVAAWRLGLERSDVWEIIQKYLES